MHIKLPAILLLLGLGLSTSNLYAENAEQKGLAIATEADRRDHGFIDSTANMKMMLRNRAGKESTRYVRTKTLEVIGDGHKSLSIFDEPADVKGTASLTFSHSEKPDDQWLYLPALKRVKRISSKSNSGPYMGSEFAFEDIGSQHVNKYTYKYLRDETLDGNDTFVMERYPVNKYSGYTKQIVWMEKQRYIVLKTDFYDRKRSLLKTLISKDFNQYLGKHWRPSTMEMTNHQSGKSTTLTLSDYKFKTGLSNSDFQKKALMKLR